MSQPSQMGNFKHQPLRGADRDRDRETERNLRNVRNVLIRFLYIAYIFKAFGEVR